MEKYGVSKENLLTELKAEYTELCEKEVSLTKTGSAKDPAIEARKQAVQKKIDEQITE